MYGGKYNYGGRGSGPKRMPQGQTQQEIHIHQEAHNPPVLGTIGFVIAVIALIIIILIGIIKIIKNSDTVIVGSASMSAWYISSGNPYFTTNWPAQIPSTPSSLLGYIGAVNFTSGYWQLTINNLITIDSTSPYVSNVEGSNITNYITFVCMDPGMTTMPGTNIDYDWTTNGPYYLNGATVISSTGDKSTNYSAFPLTGNYQSINANYTGSFDQYTASSGLLNMPQYTIYINVPSNVTYYIFNWPMFATASTTVTSYNQCAFVCNFTWNATRLSNTKSNIPYSSYFGPTTIPPTISGGSGSTSGGSGSTSGGKSGGKSTFLRNMHRPMY